MSVTYLKKEWQHDLGFPFIQTTCRREVALEAFYSILNHSNMLFAEAYTNVKLLSQIGFQICPPDSRGAKWTTRAGCYNGGLDQHGRGLRNYLIDPRTMKAKRKVIFRFGSFPKLLTITAPNYIKPECAVQKTISLSGRLDPDCLSQVGQRDTSALSCTNAPNFSIFVLNFFRLFLGKASVKRKIPHTGDKASLDRCG